MDTEHWEFSQYSFEECRREYKKYTDRPDVQVLFTRIFRNTIRSSSTNRFKSIEDVVKLMGDLTEALNQKEYIIPILPAVSPIFFGREAELRRISESLKHNNVLYVTGIGGIGKTTLVKNYISLHRTEYDIIIYLEYDGDICHTFCDDKQLQISTVARDTRESLEEYYDRKFMAFRRICAERHVLFVIDNFTGMLTKETSAFFDSGCDVILTSRSQPPQNSYSVLEINALNDTSEIYKLISLNLGHSLNKEEKICFEEIIETVQGHTLVLELIARQIATGRLSTRRALELIRENGFSRFSDYKIGNVKDGEEAYETLAAIILAMFKASSVDDDKRLALSILALLM